MNNPERGNNLWAALFKRAGISTHFFRRAPNVPRKFTNGWLAQRQEAGKIKEALAIEKRARKANKLRDHNACNIVNQLHLKYGIGFDAAREMYRTGGCK